MLIITTVRIYNENFDIKKNQYQIEKKEEIYIDPVEEQSMLSEPLLYFDCHNKKWFLTREHLRRLNPEK